MNFLYFIGALSAMGIAVSSVFFFGFWVATAGIIGTVAAYLIYTLWDGKKENDWELILIAAVAIMLMAILLGQDPEFLHMMFGGR